MAEFDRLSGGTDWIDLEFVERERTPEQIVEVGIQLHLAGLSLSNTKQYLERLGVERSRTAIHNWVQKADLQPTSDGAPNQIAVDETVIRINDERHWLYAAVDPDQTNSSTSTVSNEKTQLTMLHLREFREKQQVEQATFIVDEAHYLNAGLDRLRLRFQITRYRNRKSVEHVLFKVKHKTHFIQIRSVTRSH